MKIGVSGAGGQLGGAVVKYLLKRSNEHSIVAVWSSSTKF